MEVQDGTSSVSCGALFRLRPLVSRSVRVATLQTSGAVRSCFLTNVLYFLLAARRDYSIKFVNAFDTLS